MNEDNGPAVNTTEVNAPAENQAAQEEISTIQNDDIAEEAVEVPALSDEDYRLNFLGSLKYDLPREVSDDIRTGLKTLEKSLNKGWTEKNQELAEQRRALYAQNQELQLQQSVSKELESDILDLRALQKQLEAYDKVTPVEWQTWSSSDPSAAQQALIAYQALRGQVGRKESEVSARQAKINQDLQVKVAQYLEDSKARISIAIPDWSEAKGRTIGEFAWKTYMNGNSPADVAAFNALNLHPGLVRMANEAMLYRQSLEKAKTPPKPANTAQPVAKVNSGGSATAAKDPEKMKHSEWIALRQKEVDAKNMRRR